MPKGTFLRIGELALAAGVSAHTIRYYERIGVLPKPARTSAGYRLYPSETEEQLEFVKKAQSLGLRLAEVKDVLRIASGGQEPCEHVRELVVERLNDVETRISELRQLRQTLRDTLKLLEQAPAKNDGCRCAAIESIQLDPTLPLSSRP